MENLVTTLLEMGFPKQRIELAIEKTKSKDLQLVMDWMLSHEEELDTAPASFASEAAQATSLPGRLAPRLSPTETAAPFEITGRTEEPQKEFEKPERGPEEPTKLTATVARSVICDDCGKVFKTTEEVEFHAEKSGHENFTESTDEKKQLTEEEKKEQLALIEAKLRQRRLEREAREKEEALEKERMRIRSGKEILEAKKKHDELEMKKIIQQRKKEKEDERSARQRVREQILADKLARKVKFGDGPAPINEPVAVQPDIPDSAIEKKPSQNYSEVKLQIRLSDGKTLVQSFGIKEPLSAVRLFVEMNYMDGPFNLMNSFPRKVFTSEDYEKPLEALGLAPTATLIVTKA
ncbi:unnamed protein product [Ceutorhynchus assimilis]|uniref:C2H2-type domain-containing protein n=1 Tax=Ceutorhynchus assimilis TaxID=467358 RepID=A0A9N9QIY0_9CUCU|nr:unnamed protein product [Ceutorhynchus assimilis]